MEKVLTRGNYDKRELEVNGVLKEYLEYHKIGDYGELYVKGIKQLDHSKIEYVGDSYSFSYRNRTLTIKERSVSDYPLPQIMYVPADRNFLSSIEDLKTQRIFSPALREVLDELDKAKKEIKEDLPLPINGAYIEYDRQKDILYVKGETYKIKLSKASSGFQSFVPLFVVSRYLTNFINGQSETKEPMTSDELNKFRKDIADIYSNNDLTSEQKRAAASAVSDRYNKSAFINIVEEPEQNLFPTSQWQMLKCLLEFNNMNEGNKLIMTTHSPYIINYLSIAIEGYSLKNKIDASAKANEIAS